MNTQGLTVGNTTLPIKRDVHASEELERSRLLAQDRGQPILVAEAPSGYGKTVLAQSWIRRAPAECRTAWVSLNNEARDPVVFLERLSAALEGVKRRPRPHEWKVIAQGECAERFAEISERLANATQAVWMVFDDAHCLSGSPSRDYLRRLLFGAGPNLRIFLTLQPLELDVGLGELSARGKICWFDTATLALTYAEIEQLALLHGKRCAAQQLEWLARATRGWPVLVQLALTTTADEDRLPSTTVALASVGPVREYIHERYLARLAPAERELLWIFACIGSAPLALLEALAPGSNPDAILPRLLAQGIVQQEASEDGVSFRLHPVVRETAARLLASRSDTARSALLLAAARWYWQSNRKTAAIQSLLEAGSEYAEKALEWILELAYSLNFQYGRHQTLMDLAERWEDVAKRHDPRLDQEIVWALIFLRRFGEAHERLERLIPTAKDADPANAAFLQKAVSFALRDEYEQAGTLAHAWLKYHGADTSFTAGAGWVVHAFRLKCIGDIAGAHRALTQATSIFDKLHTTYGTAWVHVVRALTMIKAGGYRDALAEVKQGLALCTTSSDLGGHKAMLGGIEAFLHYERNELSAVRSALDEALPLLLDQGIVDAMVLGFAAAARLHVAQGELGAALDTLSDAEQCGIRRGFPRLTLTLVAERALVLVHAGATQQARQVAEAAGLVPPAEPRNGLHWDRASRLHARIALANNDSSRALELLAPLVAHARAAQQKFKLCELLILSALAEDQCKREATAFKLLEEALALAAAEHYVRVFLDEGAELHRLLHRWLESAPTARRNRIEMAWAKHLASAIADLQDPEPRAVTLAEPLTQRERQILSLLAQGLSNAEIAARCFVAESTVKWNLHNVYGKLGVKSRTAALRVAREHGILKL